jgi:hypothetical protein
MEFSFKTMVGPEDLEMFEDIVRPAMEKAWEVARRENACIDDFTFYGSAIMADLTICLQRFARKVSYEAIREFEALSRS